MAVLEFDGHDMTSLEQPSLGGKADFRTVDAPFLTTSQNDLGGNKISNPALIGHFHQFGVTGKDRLFPL